MSSKGVSQTKMTNVTAPNSSQPTTRGKRKLDFDRELHAFRGKTLFFDLPGYKHTDKLEYELTQRGGTVVKFFQREVKYLVTNRPPGDKKAQTPSTPSPHTPGTNGSKGVSAILSPVVESPSSTGSGGKSVKPQAAAPHSRAAKMLAASKLKQGGKKSVDMFEMARQWGCKVIALNDLLKELKKLKPLPKKEERNGRGNGKVYKLKAPFFKVEDQSQLYRPLIYETKQWPRPNLACSPKSSPYDSPRMTKYHAVNEDKDGSVHRSGGPAAGTRGTMIKEKRPGYCECCTTRFEDLEMHLRSAKHQEYASNSANFFSLDNLIAQGNNFSEFIASVKARRGRKGCLNSTSSPAKEMNTAMDMVVLVTPPSTPSKKRNSKTPQKSSPKRLSPQKQTRSSPRWESAAKSPTLGKKITLSGGSFSSPKQGELCIKPVMETTKMVSPSQPAKGNRDYTPGFTTPSSSNHLRRGVGQKRRRDLSENEDSPSSKRPRRNAVCHGSPKKLEIGDLVPETPEKAATRNRVNSSLYNIASVLDRIYHHKVSVDGLIKTPPTRRCCLLTDLQTLLDDVTGESPSGIRRSPRLRKKECAKKLSVKTEAVKVFFPPDSNSLVVSFRLSDVYLNKTGRDVFNSTAAVSTPNNTRLSVGGNTITPEISLQGLPPCRHPSVSSPAGSSESPLLGLQCLKCHAPFDHSSSDSGAFLGFSSDAVRRAIPDFISLNVRQTSRNKLSLDDIAVKLMSRATEKRKRESESPRHTGPASKRLKMSSGRSPRRSERLSVTGRGGSCSPELLNF